MKQLKRRLKSVNKTKKKQSYGYNFFYYNL